ncbi:MAG: methyltransferase family protein [Vulcanimicrobiaceae bacterium]
MSPWWYRQRILVLFALALIAQVIGRSLWSALGHHTSIGQLIVAHFGEMGAKAALLGSLLIGSAGVGLRIWGSGYLHADTVWSAHARAPHLIIAGPFRWLRNPLYAGNVLFFCAFAIFATPPGAVGLLVVVISFSALLIGHEAVLLQATFGDAFATYARSVPALFPRPFPVPSNGARFDLRAGLRSEIFMFGLYIGLIAYLSGSAYAFWIWALGFLLGAVIQRRAL